MQGENLVKNMIRRTSMPKRRTNSNSMTGLLITALNSENSDFRKYFANLLKIEIPANTIFLDGTHQPLLYKEMNEKQVDIIARVPGKRKPILMIEVKTNIDEDLQESQGKNNEYEETASKYKIPLIYIFPKYYGHREEIPDIAIKIEWEEILDIARNTPINLGEMIENFVDISEENILSKEERELLTNQSLIKELLETKECVLEELKQNLPTKQSQRSLKTSQYEVGYEYKYNEDDFFIGFNPCRDDEYFFSLCIKENSITDKYDKLYYEDGWYFIPIHDAKTLKKVRKDLEEIEISEELEKIEISEKFKKFLYSFYTLKIKIEDLAKKYVGEKKCSRYEDSDGIGFYFDGEEGLNYFVGFSFDNENDNKNSMPSFEIRKTIVDESKCYALQDREYFAFPLSNYKDLFNKFLESTSSDELEKNFNILINAAKAEADKYLKQKKHT